ncbi:hypothetical protein AABB24_009505, partial [Solanum stoloniferum]
ALGLQSSIFADSKNICISLCAACSDFAPDSLDRLGAIIFLRHQALKVSPAVISPLRFKRGIFLIDCPVMVYQNKDFETYSPDVCDMHFLLKLGRTYVYHLSMNERQLKCQLSR